MSQMEFVRLMKAEERIKELEESLRILREEHAKLEILVKQIEKGARKAA